MTGKASPRVVILANCQGAPLAALLSLFLNVEVLSVIAVHRPKQVAAINIEELFDASDFILSQEIHGANQSPVLRSDALQTQYPNKLLLWQNLHFSGYNPELTYLRPKPGAHLRGPLGDYHIREIVEGFREGRPELHVYNAVSDPEINRARYAEVAERALTELRRREVNTVTPVANFVQDAYTHERLFYTFNHPLNLTLFQVVLGLSQAMGVRLLQPYRAGVMPERLTDILLPLNAGIRNQMPSLMLDWPAYVGFTAEPQKNARKVVAWTRERRFYNLDELIKIFYQLYRSVGAEKLELP